MVAASCNSCRVPLWRCGAMARVASHLFVNVSRLPFTRFSWSLISPRPWTCVPRLCLRHLCRSVDLRRNSSVAPAPLPTQPSTQRRHSARTCRFAPRPPCPPDNAGVPTIVPLSPHRTLRRAAPSLRWYLRLTLQALGHMPSQIRQHAERSARSSALLRASPSDRSCSSLGRPDIARCSGNTVWPESLAPSHAMSVCMRQS